MTDWHVELAAARQPATPEQQAWDLHFDRWRRLALRQGRTPNQAIPIAYRRTEDQYGPRPGEINTTEET